MNVLLRGVRVIDPLAGSDRRSCSAWLRDGRLVAIDRKLNAHGAVVVDLSRSAGAEAVVLCPGFIDLHAHLREPGEERKETIRSGAAAAAAGGFAQVVAMANTTPTVDSPARVGQARARSARAPVRILAAAAVSRGLHGSDLVDIPGCAAAGAAAFSDDGRNAAPPRLLAEAIRAAADSDRAVLVHPEDEGMVAAANPGIPSVVRASLRPAACEATAVETALRALADAGRGRLHLQHLSAGPSLTLLRAARDLGLAVTAEVTPHHLSMWVPFEREPTPEALRKVNPPLRGEHDRELMVQALREGLIDAVATDHAPHEMADKECDYDDAAPGMIGLETALATCLTLGGMGGDWLGVLVERLTAGPWRVLGSHAGLIEPRLETGERATLTLFDPAAEITVGAEPLRSLSQNTPLLGTPLRGRVLLTMVNGDVAHVERTTALAQAFPESARVVA